MISLFPARQLLLQSLHQGRFASLSSLLDSVLLLHRSLPSSAFFSGSFFTDFVGSVPGVFLLRMVRALRVFLRCISALSPHPCPLFVSPHCPSRSLSPSTLFFLLGGVILQSFPSPAPASLPSSRFGSFYSGVFFGSVCCCGCCGVILFPLSVPFHFACFYVCIYYFVFPVRGHVLFLHYR